MFSYFIRFSLILIDYFQIIMISFCLNHIICHQLLNVIKLTFLAAILNFNLLFKIERCQLYAVNLCCSGIIMDNYCLFIWILFIFIVLLINCLFSAPISMLIFYLYYHCFYFFYMEKMSQSNYSCLFNSSLLHLIDFMIIY